MNIVFYDHHGKPFVEYRGSEIEEIGKPETFDDPRSCSLPVLYASLANLMKNQNPRIERIRRVLTDKTGSLEEYFKPKSILTSTIYNYRKKLLTHGSENQIRLENMELPKSRDGDLNELVKKKEWEIFLRSLFMTDDISQIPEVLEFAGIAKPRLLTFNHLESNPILVYPQPALLSSGGVYLNTDFEDKLYGWHVLSTSVIWGQNTYRTKS